MELVNLLTVEGFTREQSVELLKIFARILGDTLEAGRDIHIRGLGSFSIKPLTRQIQNFQTKERIKSHTVKRVLFRPSDKIRRAINS